MSYVGFWRGVHLRHPRLTRDWRRWRGYVCWWLQTNIRDLGPPPWWRLIPKEVRKRQHARRPMTKEDPWMLFCGWWSRRRIALSRPFHRYVGEYASRCDWTDREHGRLYGGEGGEINRAFEVFLERIEPTPEQKAAVTFAVDELQRRLMGEPPDDNLN